MKNMFALDDTFTSAGVPENRLMPDDRRLVENTILGMATLEGLRDGRAGEGVAE
jgi:hypothetical protein